jgi:hypothetical protein
MATVAPAGGFSIDPSCAKAATADARTQHNTISFFGLIKVNIPKRGAMFLC